MILHGFFNLSLFQAEELKNLGNKSLQSGNVEEAINLYTEAIGLDPENHILWSNRSAAYCKNSQYEKALEDAEKIIQINPNWSRGYSRKGAALHGLERLDEAIESYKKGLELDPNNDVLKQSLASVENALRSQSAQLFQQFSQFFDGDVQSTVRKIPQIAQYADDPEFMRMVNEIKADQSKIGQYLSDNRIMTYISLVLQQTMGGGQPSEPQPQKETPPPKKEEPKGPELTDNQKKAEELKNQGNKLYKARKFDEALELYDQAYQVDPENLIYLLNKTAVIFEKQEYEKCMQECEAIIDLAREKRADFKIIGKALGRIGNCHIKLGNREMAIECYKKSLTEFRDPVTLANLRKLEKEIEEEAKRAYINPELSDKAKEEGNEHFKAGRYPEAIKCYTEAIKRNPENHILYGNRATAYSKLGEYHYVIKDCDQSLALNDSYIRAYVRKAQAYYMLKEYSKSLEWYEKGLKIDPNNAECKTGYEKTIRVLEGSLRSEDDANLTDEERLQRAYANPEVAEILKDPVMNQILQQMSTDPKAAADHMKNPEIRKRIAILRAAGVVR